MKRPWYSHLRLLPGGDADPAAGLGVALVLYFGFLLFGLVFGLVISTQFRYQLAWLSSFSVANAIPATVLGAWVLVRLRRTKPIDLDELAVDVERGRIYPGEEAGRAPLGAVVLPVRPRQLTAELADGTRLRLFYRITRDPDDMLRLARLLRAKGQELEDWVQDYLRLTVPGLLPDPEGVEAGLAEELVDQGVLVTRGELV